MTRIARFGLTASFWLFSFLIALISLRFLAAPLSEVMDHMAHYLPAVPLALYAHLIGAPLALMLAPFQLWQGLRRARPRLHRVLGYSYVTAVIVSGIGALALLPHFLGTGFATLAVLWIAFTLRGVVLARAGDRVAHRRFMLRSVALTLAAVTLRLIMAPLMEQGWTVVETYQVTAWGAWVPNLIVMELYIRAKSKRAPA